MPEKPWFPDKKIRPRPVIASVEPTVGKICLEIICRVIGISET